VVDEHWRQPPRPAAVAESAQLETFLEHVHDASRKRLPKYVENEFRRYLERGLHAYGFARAVCETCGEELLLPFSCKLRGICPSCNSRRMSNTAAHWSTT
jgi:hypothetical protein